MSIEFHHLEADRSVNQETYNQFIQYVQTEAFNFNLQTRIHAPPRSVEVIDRLRREQSLPVAPIWCAEFQVFYTTWRTVARELEPMTPQAQRSIDQLAWIIIKAEAARDIATS